MKIAECDLSNRARVPDEARRVMEYPVKTVCVVGLGYIGLPTAATLASRGVDVVGVDVNPQVVDAVNAGQAYFSEPDLDMLLRAATTLGKLRAVAKPEPADAFVIAVPTPFNPDRSPNLDYIDAAADAIAPALASGNVVILESTSPVGTTARLAARLARLRPDLRFPPAQHGEPLDVHVAHCPERVLPGQMVRELIENDRIIGGMTEACAEHAESVYRVFLRGAAFRTEAATAELVKLVENAYRDVNIAFANELSVICDQLGLNVWDVIELANRHPRVSILQPGAGVGGHCIAVDPWFIVASAPERARLIRTAREVNDDKPKFVAAQIRERAERFKQPVVACLGLTYKPDVDDVRESPAIEIVRELGRCGGQRVVVADPHLHALPPALAAMPNLVLAATLDAVRQADIVALLVGHAAFRKIPREELLRRVVIDVTGLTRGNV
jgi:UDP-N-acetyl-D-mannosaminuronic acid dehydrogenase